MSTIFEYVSETSWFDEGHFEINKPRNEWLSSETFSCSICRFCGSVMRLVASQGSSAEAHFNLVFCCPTCGWWNAEGADYLDLQNGTVVIREALVVGVLRTYDASDLRIPLDLLLSEIAKRPSLAYETNPHIWEKLIGNVLADVFSCNVVHIGRSGDGGIDLLLVDGDSPVAIQVKRRAKPGSVEQVSLVREFLGATLLRGYRNATLITTAKGYTKPAKIAAAKSESLGLVDNYELLDFPKVIDLLRSTATTVERWRPYCDHMWLHKDVGY